MTGIVLSGSRNVFIVAPLQSTLSSQPATADNLICRIKGKILKDTEDCYNPLAPGDRVLLEDDPLHPGTALIIGVEKRKKRSHRNMAYYVK